MELISQTLDVIVRIEHRPYLPAVALYLEWRTRQPLFKKPVRCLNSVRAYITRFFAADATLGEVNVPAVVVSLHEDLHEGVGLLVMEGETGPAHIMLAVLVAGLEGLVTEEEADAAQRELGL